MFTELGFGSLPDCANSLIYVDSQGILQERMKKARNRILIKKEEKEKISGIESQQSRRQSNQQILPIETLTLHSTHSLKFITATPRFYNLFFWREKKYFYQKICLAARKLNRISTVKIFRRCCAAAICETLQARSR